jgi:hypothetical protein
VTKTLPADWDRINERLDNPGPPTDFLSARDTILMRPVLDEPETLLRALDIAIRYQGPIPILLEYRDFIVENGTAYINPAYRGRTEITLTSISEEAWIAERNREDELLLMGMMMGKEMRTL